MKNSINKLKTLVNECNPEACYKLGLEYYFGKNINKDLTKAFELLYRAYNLGYMCLFSLQMVYDDINS